MYASSNLLEPLGNPRHALKTVRASYCLVSSSCSIRRRSEGGIGICSVTESDSTLAGSGFFQTPRTGMSSMSDSWEFSMSSSWKPDCGIGSKRSRSLIGAAKHGNLDSEIAFMEGGCVDQVDESICEFSEVSLIRTSRKPTRLIRRNGLSELRAAAREVRSESQEPPRMA